MEQNSFGRFAIGLVAAQLLLSASIARAADDFGHSWPTLLQKLEDEGISSVGAFDFAQFATQAQGLTWKTLPGPPTAVLSGSRESASFTRKTRTISISKNLSSDTQASLPSLELHEALGALGYNDQNYAMSTSLALLGKIVDGAKREVLRASLASSIFSKPRITAAAGGFSGGGDVAAITIKNLVLERLMKTPQIATLDFLTTYPKIDFEPVTSVDYVSLDYKIRRTKNVLQLQQESALPNLGTGSKSGVEELVSIFFPIKTWQRGGSERAQMLTDIEKKMISIFPIVNAGDEALSGTCAAPAKIEFPAESGSDLRSIQEAREKILSGCNTNQNSIEITVPGLPAAAKPSAAGEYHFNCTFKFSDGQTIAARLTTHHGVAGEITTQTTVIPDVLFGTLVVDANGRIVGTVLMYNASDDALPSLKQAAVKDPSRSSISMKVRDENVTFACASAP